MKFGGLLKALAPTIGTAVGGPMGGMAAKMVASKLGIKKTDTQSIEEALEEASPEQLEEIKVAEKEFALKMKQMNVDVFAKQVEDVQDARKVFGDDPIPKLFAMLALVGFLAYVFLVTMQEPESNDDAIVNLVLGYLGGLVSGISAFFFGANNSRK
tara:strand:+ start:91 stop:558 length:468 start_codon:yes stop_codon:yes gene_type:complete